MMKIGRSWGGMLTTENANRVAEVFNEMFDGKIYTSVEATENGGFVPAIRTGQKLVSPVSANKREGSAGLSISDTYGVWCLDTRIAEDKYDPEFSSPWIKFEYDQVLIIHRAPNGQRLYWAMRCEQDRSAQ